jgi:UTP--glucose-1-phosphate uridylyltransferase
LQPEVFDELDSQTTGAGGEIQLTDSMARLIGKQPFHGLRFKGTRYDCGDKIGFIEANVAFSLADPENGEKVRAALKKLVC